MNKIEKSKYTGYLWCSDKTEPKVLQKEEFEIELDDNKNPFIIEGWLTDGDISISIKYVDGEYLIKKYDFRELEKDDAVKEIKQFLPSFKDDNVSKLVFEQYWRPEDNIFHKDMKVLEPKEFVFSGFRKK